MEKLKSGLVLRILLIMCCLFSALIGFLIVFEPDSYDVLGYSSFQLGFMDVFNVCYLIVVPFGLLIAMIVNNRVLCGLMIIMWEALWIADYIILRAVKEYHMLKPFYLLMNAITIVAVLFWMFKKMNGFIMLIIMILTNLDWIRLIRRYLMDLRFLNVVVFLFCLFMHILPMFVIKDKREIL